MAADPSQELYIVPAFTGLGAPYWDAHCRGAIYGLTRNSGPAEFAKAALRSVAYQTKDLLDAMHNDIESFDENINIKEKSVLRVDGGMSASDYTIEFLADILGTSVDRPEILETTALGVAFLAGMKKGFYTNKEDFANNWHLEKRFESSMDIDIAIELYKGWTESINRTLSI